MQYRSCLVQNFLSRSAGTSGEWSLGTASPRLACHVGCWCFTDVPCLHLSITVVPVWGCCEASLTGDEHVACARSFCPQPVPWRGFLALMAVELRASRRFRTVAAPSQPRQQRTGLWPPRPRRPCAFWLGAVPHDGSGLRFPCEQWC